ncbi:MAG TPA: Rnase Y domain-containing protein, partial [Pirellulaceae bacterium]|nr:Rnase Y domain-containing protein [Pirellulaceae bacterium]
MVPYFVGGAIGLALGIGLYWLFGWFLKRDARQAARQIVEQANLAATSRQREAELKAKETMLNAQADIEKHHAKIREEQLAQTLALDKRKSQIDQQAEGLVKQEQIVQTTQNRLKSKLEAAAQREKDLNEIYEKQRQQLHKITGLNKEEATSRLLKLLEDELAQEVGARISAHEQRFKEECETISREMLLVTMQRFAAAHTADTTTSTVDIPSDEMKGRIIGREGRNIRAFEKETGVDLIIDDTPGVVIVSCFDPVRREVARQSLERLIDDGRIHPSRIEEIVKQVNGEINRFIEVKGKEAVQEVNLHGIHPRVVEYLGRLHFRTSYSQNVLRHSVVVAFLSGMLAELV